MRTFDMAAQRAFAELSGDENPLHVDPVAARRTPFGFPLVHGVHAALWVLDTALEGMSTPQTMESLRATFRSPVRVSDVVNGEVLWRDANTLDATVENEGRAALRLATTFSPGTTGVDAPRANPERVPCAELSFEAAASASGALALAVNRTMLKELLPHVARVCDPSQVAELLATTRLVGMTCPGLHSTFAEINLARHPSRGAEALFNYRVSNHNARFLAISLAVEGPTLSGTLKAFYRPPPVAQASAPAIASLVTRGEFAKERVLVVGGSRGLGEVAAKIAAAGGADVVVTFHRGEVDARRVAAEIEGSGGHCRTAPLDVTKPMTELASRLGSGWLPTGLLYFATPHIGGGDAPGLSLEKLRTMIAAYVDGFYEVARAAHALGGDRLAVLYPSTVFLDHGHTGFAEYCIAKAAGEALCAKLPEMLRGVSVMCHRLPRMRTDQTQGILGGSADEPAPILLREMRRLFQSP